MTKNYFAIERQDRCFEHMCITNDLGAVMFEELMDMSYDEMKVYDRLEEFVATAMKISNEVFKSDDEETVITLVGEDDVFIWGIIVGPEDSESFKYVLVDWKKDGKNYRYQKN